VEKNMSQLDGNAESIRPDLIRRTGGGWLAVSPKEAKISIGVTALSNDDAVEKFKSVYARWEELLSENT
jgi:hypothetical protein